MILLATTFLFFVSWAIPTWAALLVRGRRRRSDFWLTLSVVVGAQALIAAFCHERMAFGWTKYVTVMLASFPPAVLFLQGTGPRAALPRTFWRWGIVVVGALLFAENLWVLGSQGWHPLFGSETYFRPPFNNDGQRHVILVEALLRGTAAPFVPGLTLTYQVLWHHHVAVVAALFPGPTHYPVIQGALLASSLVGALVIFWSLTVLSPRSFLKPWGWAIALLALLHADLFHVVRMLLQKGYWGMEADWSSTENFFRYFSLNLVWLTAPQHQLFFLWLAGFLGVSRREKREKYWSAQAIFLFSLCWISSSLLAIFFFPFYFAGTWKRYWQKPSQLVSAFVGVAVAYALHWIALGFSVVKLFTRDGNGKPEWFWVSSDAWPLLPLTGVATSGVLGLALLALLLWELRHFKRSRIFGWEWMVFGVGSLLLHFVITMPEFRRHFAMLASFAALYWLVRRLPDLYRRLPRRVWVTSGGSLALIALILHVYFVYSYTGKPSYIDPKVPWEDYLSLNEILRQKYPGVATLAAVDKDKGLDYPPVMEATTSFSAPYHAAVHVQLSPRHMDLMGRMFVTKEFIPYGRLLGYQAVVWGPFEELIWGESVRTRFVDEKFLLARSGSVGLYQITDHWEKELIAARDAKGTALVKMARKLKAQKFYGEAIDFYQVSLHDNPKQPQVWLELARTIDPLGQWAWKHEILQMALQANPQFAEGYFEMGVLRRGLGDPRGAVHAFRQAIALDPRLASAYRELSGTLAYYGNFDEARRVIDRALRAGNSEKEFSQLRAALEKKGNGG